jgi:hypothetical protein
MDIITNNGFLQLILKATRIQNNSFSLIDHIFVNNISGTIKSGVIISDISDHFITFLQSPIFSKPKIHKTVESRSFNTNALNNFKNALGSLSWHSTLSSNTTNESFDHF